MFLPDDDSQSRLKDCIPRLGDRVDLVIVGACWDGIVPSPFTTFHLMVLANADM
jgi:hypothetical protein